MAFDFFLVVVGRALVLVVAEEVSGSCVAEAFLHVVGGDSLETSLDVALFVPSVVNLVFKFFHVFELGMFPTCWSWYTNFCLPPAWKAWLWMERSTFSLLYS